MSTSFSEIFEQFLLIVDESRFINFRNKDVTALELSRYLYRSIGICADYLYKDISKYEKTTVYKRKIRMGSFEVKLNEQEIVFLAKGMTVPYLEFQLQKQKHLNQMIYSKNYGFYSQAQHIKEVRDTIVEVKKELKQDLVMYSFAQTSVNFQKGGG